MILINANDPAKYNEDGWAEMQARAKSAGDQVPYVVDETSGVARAFGASVTPEAFLFDKSGKLAYHGTVDDNHLDAATGAEAVPHRRARRGRRGQAPPRRRRPRASAAASSTEPRNRVAR